MKVKGIIITPVKTNISFEEYKEKYSSGTSYVEFNSISTEVLEDIAELMPELSRKKDFNEIAPGTEFDQELSIPNSMIYAEVTEDQFDELKVKLHEYCLNNGLATCAY